MDAIITAAAATIIFGEGVEFSIVGGKLSRAPRAVSKAEWDAAVAEAQAKLDEPPFDAQAEIEALKARITKLENK